MVVECWVRGRVDVMGVSVIHVSVEDECEERKMVCGKVGLVGLVDTIGGKLQRKK